MSFEFKDMFCPVLILKVRYPSPSFSTLSCLTFEQPLRLQVLQFDILKVTLILSVLNQLRPEGVSILCSDYISTDARPLSTNLLCDSRLLLLSHFPSIDPCEVTHPWPFCPRTYS